MCKCTPSIRTPFCGKPGCEWPENKPQSPTMGALKILLAMDVQTLGHTESQFYVNQLVQKSLGEIVDQLNEINDRVRDVEGIAFPLGKYSNSTPKPENELRQGSEVKFLLKSMVDACKMALDAFSLSSEDYERKHYPFAGPKTLLDKLTSAIEAAAKLGVE